MPLEDNRTPFIVGHHWRHHLYNTALAYHDHGRLVAFVTERYAYKPGRAKWLSKLPGASDKVIRGSQYHHPELPSEKVRCYPKGLAERLLFRMLGTPAATGRAGGAWRDELLSLVEEAGAGVHLPCVAARPCFERIGSGHPKMLEQCIGNRKLMREILLEEQERLTQSADDPSQLAIDTFATDPQKVENNTIAVELADVVFCGSKFVRDTYLDDGVDPAKLRVVEYGVDSELYPFVRRERRADQPLQVAFLGQVGVRKGAAYLLEAARLLGKKAVHVHFFGRVGLPLRLLEEADQVATLHGHLTRSALVQMLRQCHVMSLPSLFEGSSLAAAEAMAQGMPLVVTPNTGSFARDGVDGHIVPIRDAEAIAEALERLRDEPARQAMGESAAARAREFTWHRYRQKLVQHVDEWLDQRGN